MASSGMHSLFIKHHVGPVGNKLTHIQSTLNNRRTELMLKNILKYWKLNENFIVNVQNDLDKPYVVTVFAS